MTLHVDALVVGGGPAGLAAALTLGRSCRATLLVDGGEPRNAPAAHMHNVLGWDGVPPGELRRRGREELAAYPTVDVRDGTVLDLAGTGEDGFTATLADGTDVRARRVVLATGLADDLAPLPGIDELWGRSVLHCPYCHGYETRGQRLAVLGSSWHSVWLAVLVRRYSDDVVLLADGGAVEEEAAAAAHGVVVAGAPLARLEGRDGQLEQVVFEDGSTLARDALFAGGTPRQRSPLAERLGGAMLEPLGVAVDDFGRTSVPGVFAAGDMARRPSQPGPMQAVAAGAAGGMIAGVGVDQDLLAADTGLPSPLPPLQALVPTP